MLRSIGILGDVHAEDVLLERALAELTALGADALLCTGDIPDGPGNLARCCELLAEHGVTTVRGNHERWLLADTMRDLPEAHRRHQLPDEVIAFVEALPATQRLSSSLGEVLLCHGLGDDDMGSVLPDDRGYALEVNDELHRLRQNPTVDIVINGHTHRPMVRHFDGLTIVNAGTLLHRHDPGFVFANLETGRVDYHRLHARAGERVRLGSLFP